MRNLSVVKWLCPLTVFFSALIVPADVARGDSWRTAIPIGIASPTGDIVVRIVPGDSLGDTYGFAGAETGRYAAATYYKLLDDDFFRVCKIELLNPIAPVFAALANDGSLITLDNWHNMGIGQAIHIYTPSGKHRRSYSLGDLYSEAQLARMEMSVSSLWWRCGEPILEADTATLHIQDKIGGILKINVSDGSYSYRDHGSVCVKQDDA